MNTTIAIADAQYLTGTGLASLLKGQADLEVVGTATDKESLFDLLDTEHPDVLVLDYKSQAFGHEVVDEIRAFAPDTRLLIISGDNDKSTIYHVLERNVNSFLTKYCGRDEIITAIRATARDERFFCNKILDYLLQKSFGKAEAESCEPIPLTAREQEVVRHIAAGKTAKEIAEELYLSTHTIYTYRKNIMKKMNFGSASELVIYAVNSGLVDKDPSD